MTIDIDELRRLEAAATKGPWYASGRHIGLNEPGFVGIGATLPTQHLGVFSGRDDAALACAARNALPHLLDLIDKLLTHERCHAAGVDANARELIAMDAAEIARLRARVAELEANAADLEQVLESTTSQRDFVLDDRDGLRAALAEAKRKADDHRRQRDELAARVCTTADECDGLAVDETPDAAISRIERTLFYWRKRASDTERERDTAIEAGRICTSGVLELNRRVNELCEQNVKLRGDLADMTERYHQSTRDEEVLRDQIAHRGAYGSGAKP